MQGKHRKKQYGGDYRIRLQNLVTMHRLTPPKNNF